MVNFLSGRGIHLRPLEQADLGMIHVWRNDPKAMFLFANNKHPVSWEDFVAEFEKEHTRHHVFLMIERASDRKTIGYVYSYDVQFVDGHCFVGVYLDEGSRGSGLGAVAAARLIIYLFEYFSFRKIYIDAYDYNRQSIGSAVGAGFIEEGRFRGHRYYNGEFHDLVRFAVYPERVPFLCRIAGILNEGRDTK